MHVIILNNFNSISYHFTKYEIVFSFTILCEPSPDDEKKITQKRSETE